MNLKGSQRGGARQAALHFLNTDQNDHVEVVEVSGTVAEDVHGALHEMYAVSKATQCKQFMYSCSFNPPSDQNVSTEKFVDAINRTGKKLNLDGQARVIILHEKEGRTHAHCIWSRIDTDSMTAINMSHDHLKLNSMGKEIFLENNWDLPQGYINKDIKNPLNYTRAEFERAQRTDRTPREITEAIQDAWALSDNRTSLENALSERGYFLAKGRKDRFVAIDTYGEIYALANKLGLKKVDLTKRLGEAKSLPTVDNTKERISERLTQQFTGYIEDLRKKQRKDFMPLRNAKRDMTQKHRNSRDQLTSNHQERWQTEELKRSARVRKGFKGLWDKLTGSYQRTVARNENETEKARLRDIKEKEALKEIQLKERQRLQTQIKQVRQKHVSERAALFKSMNKYYKNIERQQKIKQLYEKEIRSNPAFRDDNGPDFDPQI